jgi:hypothetical protein
VDCQKTRISFLKVYSTYKRRTHSHMPDRRNHEDTQQGIRTVCPPCEGVQDGYIQGFVNLRPTSPKTGGNDVVPRSHHFYHELEESRDYTAGLRREIKSVAAGDGRLGKCYCHGGTTLGICPALSYHRQVASIGGDYAKQYVAAY